MRPNGYELNRIRDCIKSSHELTQREALRRETRIIFTEAPYVRDQLSLGSLLARLLQMAQSLIFNGLLNLTHSMKLLRDRLLTRFYLFLQYNIHNPASVGFLYELCGC